jgi:predicted deacylase
MNAIIAAQGSRGSTTTHPTGALSFEVCAPADGVVAGIDNVQIARIARLAGAPKVQGAGVDLLRKLGHAVAAGEPAVPRARRLPCRSGVCPAGLRARQWLPIGAPTRCRAFSWSSDA